MTRWLSSWFLFGLMLGCGAAGYAAGVWACAGALLSFAYGEAIGAWFARLLGEARP